MECWSFGHGTTTDNRPFQQAPLLQYSNIPVHFAPAADLSDSLFAGMIEAGDQP